MGNESYVYSFIRIAKCEEVVQWGFDKTSLNGIPTLNQWCRIKEDNDYVIITIISTPSIGASLLLRSRNWVKAWLNVR